MAKKGQKLSAETRAKISAKASQRLRFDGKFISKEKVEALKEIATNEGVKSKDVQQWLIQNDSDFRGFIQGEGADTTFTDSSYFSASKRYGKIYVNGVKVTKSEFLYRVSQVNNYAKTNYSSGYTTFNAKIKDVSTKTQKANRIDVVLPTIHTGRGAKEKNEAEFKRLEKAGKIQLWRSGEKYKKGTTRVRRKTNTKKISNGQKRISKHNKRK